MHCDAISPVCSPFVKGKQCFHDTLRGTGSLPVTFKLIILNMMSLIFLLFLVIVCVCCVF
jgi:hypothetical protein